MNSENNDLTNVGPTVNPTEVSGGEQPGVDVSQGVTPVLETPTDAVVSVDNQITETPVEQPMPVDATVTPEVPAAEPMPVETPVTLENQTIEVSTEATPVVADTPVTSEQLPASEEPKKKNNLLLIIIICVLLVAAIGCGAYFMFGKSNDEPASAPKDNTNTTVKEDDSVQSEFLDLAKEYSSTVEKMWKEENILCQDALDASKVVKPSELSESNSFGGTAYYYVFIDTDATDEIKLNVSNTKSVAGWVRVGKKDNSFYVALSDGKNYIVDKGDGQDVTAIETSDLKTSDVNTSGNGNNYQYKNGTIYGAASQGDGWRIGDAVVLNDSDTTNDGDYMSNGPKDGGYTPFCKNVE